MKAYLKNVLKFVLGKELAGAFQPNRKVMHAAEMSVSNPNDILSWTLIVIETNW